MNPISHRNAATAVASLMILMILTPLTAGSANYGKDENANQADYSFVGMNENDHSGMDIDIVGDVNGDKTDDFVISAYNFCSPGMTYNGKVYLILGGDETNWNNLNNLSSVEKASWVGNSSYDFAGYAVDGAGDVNADGYDDIIIGAHNHDKNGDQGDTGAVYIIFGKSTGWSTDVDLENADVVYYGASAGDKLGHSVAGVGDVNGDGFDDVVVGAPYGDDSATNAGQAYLLLGRSSGWDSTGAISNANATFLGENSLDELGNYVSGAGDVNGDGLDDLLLGAAKFDSTSDDMGKSYLILGSYDDWDFSKNAKSVSAATFVGEQVGSFAGSCLTGLGDINGDGFDDILIGAQYYGLTTSNEEHGQIYIYYGMEDGWTLNNNVSGANLSFHGEVHDDELGFRDSCAYTGDVNGDGYDDFFVGSKGNNESGFIKGQAYLVLGRGNFVVKNTNIGTIAAMSWHGDDTGDRLGRALSGGGDVNLDGYDDLIMGAPFHNHNSVSNVGRTYLLFPFDNQMPNIINSLTVYKTADYASTIDNADVGDTVYIKVKGGSGDQNNKDTVLLNVTTSRGHPMGTLVRLRETAVASGEYRGELHIQNRTRENHRWIKAIGNETMNLSTLGGLGPSQSIFILGDLRVDTANKNPSVIEDSRYESQYIGDGAPVLHYSFQSNAEWLQFNETNRTVFGTPDNSQVGTFWTNVTVSDDYNQKASINESLLVQNNPPSIHDLNPSSAIEDQEYIVDFNCSDDGQGQMRWSADMQFNGTPWLFLNQSSGVLNGTPRNKDVGSLQVQLMVDDGNGGTDTKSLLVNIQNVNDPPTILTDDQTTALEDQEYHVQYLADEIDPGDRVYWKLDTNITSDWLLIDRDTGVLNGTPLNEDVGEYWVMVSALDQQDAVDQHNFTLSVINVNDRPEITSTPVTEATAQIRYTYLIEAVDVDRNDDLSFSLVDGPGGMTVDNGTGLVSWTPTEEQGGDHEVTVEVSDGNDTDQQSFSITVEVPQMYAPVVSLSTPVNGSMVNVTNPEITWWSEDPDSSVVYFDVYLSTDERNVRNWDASALVAEDLTDTVYIPSPSLDPDQTYYWTVEAFDGENRGRTPDGVWSFTITNEAVESRIPTVVLNQPMDGSGMTSLPVQLKWSGADPDSEIIYYSVYLSTDRAAITSLDPGSRLAEDIEETSLLADDLKGGQTYFWTVTPFDGENRGKCQSGIWSFDVSKDVKKNRAPSLNSTPVTEGFEGQGYLYEVDALDEDGDRLSYSLRERPAGMVIDSSTGLIVWNPGATDIGTHQVVVRVSDGSLYVEQIFEVEIRPASEINHLPTVLSTPVEEAKVGKEYRYKVSATDLDSDILSYKISTGPDGMTIDPETGMIHWTPSKSQAGEHSISVLIGDGKDGVYHNYTIDVIETGSGASGEDLPWLPLLMIIALIAMVATVLAMAGMRRRSGRSEPDGAEGADDDLRAGATPAGDAGAGDDMDPGSDYGAGEEPYGDGMGMYQEAHGPQESPSGYGYGYGQAPAAEAGSATWAATGSTARAPEGTDPKAAAGGVEDGVEDFRITEIFLIYNDGRPLSHSSINEADSLDKDLVSSMLVAIQNFVKQSFQTEGGLDSFEFSGQKVILQGGQYLVLAAVLEGTEPEVLRDEMSSVVSKIEGLYAGVVEQWDGDSSTFEGVRKYMAPLFRLRSQLKIKKRKRKVKVKSGVEFYSGYVRLKVGVSNDTEGQISNINLELDYDHNTLNLSHIEPEYPSSDSTVYLPEIEAREKRTVAFYFDPIICQESHIDGWATFVDEEGNPARADMKRRPVDIVCPIFYTRETVNVAMLKRLLKELKYDDSRVFEASDEESLRAAYDLAKSAARAHDVKEVREFVEEPWEAESWFYGEIRETDERLVIKISASSELEFLEIFVASGNLASMTGLLAELSNVFVKELGNKGIEGNLVAFTDEEVKDVIRDTTLLLDKYSEEEGTEGSDRSEEDGIAGPEEIDDGDPGQ